MPLVVPGITTNNLGGDKTEEWSKKLVGKTIADEPSSETVRFVTLPDPCRGSDALAAILEGLLTALLTLLRYSARATCPRSAVSSNPDRW